MEPWLNSVTLSDVLIHPGNINLIIYILLFVSQSSLIPELCVSDIHGSRKDIESKLPFEIS